MRARWRALASSPPSATGGLALKSRQIRRGQIAALFAAIVVCMSAQLALAGPIAAVGQPTVAQSPGHRPPAQAKDTRGLPAASVATAAPPESEPAPIVPRGRAYLFRGAMGLIFSRGMDRLREKLEQAGITADVYEFTLCSLIAGPAIDDYRKDPAPIILIGHSMGGRCALQFAERLRDEGIPVALVVTIDPAHLSPDVPLNVERFINIFLSKDVLGGGDIRATPGFQGHYASYDLDRYGELSHITIDKSDLIHQQLVAKIVELVATPAKVEGETVQLRYVIPPKEDIELWDSGTSIAARAGDTLQTLAAQYRLPLWSLTQVNKMADSAQLAAGQRVVVPRHLLPLTAAAAAPVSSGR
jgi:hypothetical protein